jgi:hypothetical protein
VRIGTSTRSLCSLSPRRWTSEEVLLARAASDDQIPRAEDHAALSTTFDHSAASPFSVRAADKDSWSCASLSSLSLTSCPSRPDLDAASRFVGRARSLTDVQARHFSVASSLSPHEMPEDPFDEGLSVLGGACAILDTVPDGEWPALE